MPSSKFYRDNISACACPVPTEPTKRAAAGLDSPSSSAQFSNNSLVFNGRMRHCVLLSPPAFLDSVSSSQPHRSSSVVRQAGSLKHLFAGGTGSERFGGLFLHKAVPGRAMSGYWRHWTLFFALQLLLHQNLNVSTAAVPPKPSPALSPSTSPAPAPATLHTPAPTTGGNGTLDSAQARALALLGISVGRDPCNTALQRNVICDSSAPYKHVIFLHLEYCAMDQVFPASAWDNLTTLQSLYFSDCPARQMLLPKQLVETVTTLQVVASLGRSVDNPLAQGLTGVWLSKFYNARKLAVQDVVVNVSTLGFILGNMSHLQELTFSNTNLTGPLPTKWMSTGLMSLEVSGNDLEGGIPVSITHLTKLSMLDLSSSNLSGPIPSTIGDLSLLQTLKLGSNKLRGQIPISLRNLSMLQYLDLSHNQLNGSMPEFLSNLPALRYLDLSNNNFRGQIPFNSSFIKSLNTVKLGNNALLCYNSSLISSKLVTGLQPCDSNGLPSTTSDGFSPSPSPEPESQGFSSSSHHSGPKRIVLIVAIALASIVGLIVIVVVLSRCCSSK
ncbi:hypothetical protein KP509_23G074600 [Ceratopteris richardii]|uniref:Uncharacterized protein n=1 Tax=Ceratopteris richardii TaxID=49495 RepID=A0A8T2S376_CERRI|nr:hypothetical protein KP509_23G074600 [Ceratopteris richardii]KAH7302462.1 hypothetical protein KP509_23G074600 [Ceratopteris richardii]KAH7302463.1 hypothetical protein KP509_23G074600 [Ceratopteris richardii]KAH7302464.1 hypothetical protein KP509_23G074600 [Ceratopteris richardii]KAH7302465.1 hypothetical protein KP509_23G074600 [Ceratopteris richardii]